MPAQKISTHYYAAVQLENGALGLLEELDATFVKGEKLLASKEFLDKYPFALGKPLRVISLRDVPAVVHRTEEEQICEKCKRPLKTKETLGVVVAEEVVPVNLYTATKDVTKTFGLAVDVHEAEDTQGEDDLPFVPDNAEDEDTEDLAEQGSPTETAVTEPEKQKVVGPPKGWGTTRPETKSQQEQPKGHPAMPSAPPPIKLDEGVPTGPPPPPAGGTKFPFGQSI